jgi:hypothetical protein
MMASKAGSGLSPFSVIIIIIICDHRSTGLLSCQVVPANRSRAVAVGVVPCVAHPTLLPARRLTHHALCDHKGRATIFLTNNWTNCPYKSVSVTFHEITSAVWLPYGITHEVCKRKK